MTKCLEVLEADKPDEGAMASVQTELASTKDVLTRTQAELGAQKEVKSELTKHVEALEKERHDYKVQATL